MTRTRLFEIAHAAGLHCDVERVTTGPENGPAFREFEFVGKDAATCAAVAKSMRDEWGVGFDFCIARPSDHDGTHYVLVSSFWCEPAPKDTK